LSPRDEHIDLEVEQFRKESWNSLIAVRESWFDDDVTTVDVSVLPKSFTKCVEARDAKRP
jgi:hypothetical protein